MPLGTKNTGEQYPTTDGQSFVVGSASSPVLLHYYIGAIVWIGCFGNLTCLLLFTFRRPALTRLCAIQYLRAAVGVDLVYLCCLGIIWLREIGVDWSDSPALCGSVIYFANTCTFASAWMVTMIASQTASAVAERSEENALPNWDYPRWSTLRRITMLLFTGCLLNTWTLPSAAGGASLRYFGSGVSRTKSSGTSSTTNTVVNSTIVSSWKAIGGRVGGAAPSCHVDLLEMDMLRGLFGVFDTLINFALPAISAVILTVWATLMLRHVAARERRLVMIIDSPARLGDGTRYFEGADALLNARDNKDAFTLSLAKCLTYLVSTLPMLFYRVWIIVYGKLRADATTGAGSSNAIVYTIVHGLFYTQFSWNIVIYCTHAIWGVANRDIQFI